MVKAIPAIITLINAEAPDLLSAWLYYPALLAAMLRPFLAKKPALVFHIRSLPFVRFSEKPARYMAQRLLALITRLFRIPVVSNSEAARKAHAAIGFRATPDQWHVIPNAVDTDRYKPDRVQRLARREALGLSEPAILLGAVGRNAPEKGYSDLLHAFEALYHDLPASLSERLHLVIAGRHVSEQDAPFATFLDKTRWPRHHIHVLGARDDIPALMNSFDLFVMPSRSESFPNVLVEAMATGLACVATDVGDCRIVLEDERFIATADTLALRLAFMLSLSSDERASIGQANRQRVETLYTTSRMVEGFDAVYAQALAKPSS
jgi:glycosyltransferase involved in cell wall biosynthesis